MSDPTSFQGPALANGPHGRRTLTLIAVVIVGFIGIAIAKPWGGPATPVALTPAPSTGISAIASPADSPTGMPPAPEPSVAGPPTPAVASRGAFVTPAPLPRAAAWTGITWHRLDPSDPLNLVRSVVQWRGGYLALGSDPSGATTATPMWASTDGARWELVAGDFWPGLEILNVFEVGKSLVAITTLGDQTYCIGGPGCVPVMSWTSPDGVAWAPRGSFNLEQPKTSTVAPHVALGPSGLVALSSGMPAHAAISADGVRWTALPDSTLSGDVVINNLRATPTGYIAGGLRVTGTGTWSAVTLWSVDGRRWTATNPPSSVASTAIRLAASRLSSTVVLQIVAGSAGVIAVGRDVATPGTDLWWHSADGRRWRALPGYPPLGPTTCTGEGCGLDVNGVLVGDGRRMVALRGGPDSRAWTSADGLAWRSLRVSGDLPNEQATQVTLLPGGVLLSDGSTTWFGEATTK